MKKGKIKPRTIIQEALLLICTLIMLVPVYYFVIGAFKSRMDIIRHPFSISAETFTIKNFPYTLKHLRYLEAIKNTGVITFFSLALVVLAASLAGFAIARIHSKFFQVYYAVLVAMMVIPFIGCVIPLTVMSVNLHLYNRLLGCILIQVAWNLPFAVFLFVGFMKTIPRELEEAAYLDGCSTFEVYWKIFLPILRPVTATCCIRTGVMVWNDYLVSSALLNANQTPTLMVGVQQFFGARATEFGYAFAAIILSSIPMVILFLCMQKNFIKGLAAGAVKS
mgnify:FL=1